MKNIAKFSAVKNNVSDELRELSNIAEDLVAKALYQEFGKEEILQKFSGQGIFEKISPERENDSIELLNNKLSAHLFAVSYKTFRPDVELAFDEKTYLPDAKTAQIIKSKRTWQDPIFRSAFAVAYETAISPAAQSLAVGFYDVDVNSNEIFVVDEIGQDSFKVARQRLLNKTYTATPRPYGAATAVNFYHMASGKANWALHIMNIARGYVKKWNLMAIESLKTTIDEAMTAGGGSTPYFKATLNDDNHFGLVSLLESANDSSNINVYGDLLAVSKLVPGTGSDKQATEWAERGFVAYYKGTNVYKLRNTLIPGTINTDPKFGAPTNYLWYINEVEAPIHLVFEGETLTVNRDSFQTGDGTIEFEVFSNFAMIYVPASKIGAIVIN